MDEPTLQRCELDMSMIQDWYEQYRTQYRAQYRNTKQGQLPSFDDLTKEQLARFAFNMGAFHERKIQRRRDISRILSDKLFITEVLNDLHKYGFHGGKAKEMLHDWARELRDGTGVPRSKLKEVFSKIIGTDPW